MNVISLWQPWASLLAAGRKRIETRSWPLHGRLPITLAVHAAKRFTSVERSLCQTEPFRSALAAIGYDAAGDLPLGCVVGIVTVTRVYQFGYLDRPSSPERDFGDFTPGRWGWATENNRLLAEPIPLKGCQGVWDWTPPADLKFADGGRVIVPRAAAPAESAQLDLFAGQ